MVQGAPGVFPLTFDKGFIEKSETLPPRSSRNKKHVNILSHIIINDLANNRTNKMANNLTNEIASNITNILFNNITS